MNNGVPKKENNQSIEFMRIGSPFFGVQSFTNQSSPTSSKQGMLPNMLEKVKVPSKMNA